MFEILLLRVFSVTMLYHFAFMAISIALFGMTVGAVFVYAWPAIFTNKRIHWHLAANSLWFAVTVVASFILYLFIPFDLPTITGTSWVNFLKLTSIYLLISIPFVFSGICLTLALTKFPDDIGRMYAADLIGAALGCVLLIVLLSVMSGPTSILAIGILAGFGALFFALGGRIPNIQFAIFAVIGIFILLGVMDRNGQSQQSNLLHLQWVKGEADRKPIYEKWNSFSRITVLGDKDELVEPKSWGLSLTYPKNKRIRELWLQIDSSAATPLTEFNGNLETVDFLTYDIVNSAHHMRKNADVLVIGSGGGRDVLSALAFKQKSVVGVEINGDILKTANETFGDFTGHIDRYPQVTFISDEARSFVARTPYKFDIIQASLIDSWAATVNGAFALSENSLYTSEAWSLFLHHLNPHGILTFSRWYFRDQPGEVYRLVTLANSALMNIGVQNPRNHIVVIRRMDEFNHPDAPDGIGTILVSIDPFSEMDLSGIREFTNRMHFEVVLSPQFTLDNTFETLASSYNTEKFLSDFPINISAPTDDNPYFFHMIRFNDLFNLHLQDQGMNNKNLLAITTLRLLLIITFIVSLAFIVTPLAIKSTPSPITNVIPLMLYFTSIGLGFMLIEISQMQRLIILLGHPVYGLSVLLFSLLVASGIGSYTTQFVKDLHIYKSTSIRISALILSLSIFGVLTPHAIRLFEAQSTAIHILLSISILLPIGFFMGMALPMGMRLANIYMPKFKPLLWGINGAVSVFASVLATTLALNWGITAVFWIGVGCYIITLVSLIALRHTKRVA